MIGSEDSESALGLFINVWGLLMNMDPPPPTAEDGIIGGTKTLGKNAVDLVGVLVSSDSLMHKGLEEPDLDGPGEAIEEYPELLKLDSEAVRLAQVVIMVKGLK